MGARGTKAHGCSVQGCDGAVTHDLILSKRNIVKVNKYKGYSKEVVNHVYLCDEHAEMMHDFMETYEGR